MSAANTTVDQKVFTFDSIMGKVRTPKPETVSVFLAYELAPRLAELEKLLAAEAVAPAERGVDDPDPAEALLAEFNYLATEWNESEVVFVVRAVKRSDRTLARAAMVADGLNLEDEDADDISRCYVLANVCLNSPMTGKQFLEFRETIGEIAFLPLLEAMATANIGATVNVPFLLKPSPSPDSI